QGKTLLPLYYDLQKKDDFLEAVQDYNYFAMVLQREIEKKKDWDRLNLLNIQLNPNNFTSLFLNQDALIAMQKEKEHIESRLTNPPVEEAVFKSLQAQTLRLAKLLEITLTD